MADALAALQRALLAADHPLAHHALQRLTDKGLAHDHVRLLGSGWLARIPKQSQMGLAATDNLAYQRACFERAAPGGRTPRLHSVLPPSDLLPWGALLVQEVEGRPARLPQDLPGIVAALASLHALALPAPAERAPLLDAADPLLDLLQEITAQAAYLERANVAPMVHSVVARQLNGLQQLCDRVPRPPRCLIAFDGHPGNFIVRADGSAVLVDLEKCRYSYPGLDLAHATLYTSTTWDLHTHAVLTQAEVVDAYRAWAHAVGPWRQRHKPGTCRCAAPCGCGPSPGAPSGVCCRVSAPVPRRRARTGRPSAAPPALVTHVRERVDHYLSEPVVERVLQGFDPLERALGV